MTEKKGKWYYNTWFIVGMLVTVGPLAFPLLWKSDRLSRGAKWAITIVFTILTAVMIWLSVVTVKLVWKRFQELQAALTMP